MLWVLNRSAILKHFQRVPTRYVFYAEIRKIIQELSPNTLPKQDLCQVKQTREMKKAFNSLHTFQSVKPFTDEIPTFTSTARNSQS